MKRKCKEIERLITLMDVEALSEQEREAVMLHLKVCPQCQTLSKEMGNYHQLLKDFRREEQTLFNVEGLSQTIIQKLGSTELQHAVQKQRRRVSMYQMAGKVAASVIVILALSTYIIQTSYNHRQWLSLQQEYAHRTAVNSLVVEYNSCAKETEKIIKEYAIRDNQFSHLLVEIYSHDPFINLRTLASNLCQRSGEEFAHSDDETRKMIIIDFLSSHFNTERKKH